jgi:hypothetical protein
VCVSSYSDERHRKYVTEHDRSDTIPIVRRVSEAMQNRVVLSGHSNITKTNRQID